VKIIKHGKVLWDGRTFTFEGWEVDGGTQQQFQRYALGYSGNSMLLIAVASGFFFGETIRIEK